MRNAATSLVRHVVFVALTLFSIPAVATSQRTFVASNGLDANTCSLLAPCRTFARAITQTNAGGEVIVLDSAGYGPVAITQSVTITAPTGIYAGVSVFAGDGVQINGAGIVVVLRGLTINGQGGDNGVRIIDASTVHIENCVIATMANAGITHSTGVLEVKDTIVRNGAFGIYVQAPGTAVLDRVRVEGNATGVAAELGGRLAMQDSLVTGSSNIGVVAIGGNNPLFGKVTITRSLISFNQFGVFLAPDGNSNAPPHVIVTDSTISDSSNWGVSDDSGIFEATRTSILRNNSGGLRLLGFGDAWLDGTYIHDLPGGIDVDGPAGTQIVTRGNNTWETSLFSGSMQPITAQ